MEFLHFQEQEEERQNGARPAEWSLGFRWARTFFCLTALATLTGTALNSLQTSTPRMITPALPPAINSAPDPKDQLDMREQQNKEQKFSAANAERKRQIADDSAKLLQLATDLKIEVDRTDKDTLSLSVVRKANEIEKLAHDVKQKMKLTVGGG